MLREETGRENRVRAAGTKSKALATSVGEPPDKWVNRCLRPAGAPREGHCRLSQWRPRAKTCPTPRVSASLNSAPQGPPSPHPRPLLRRGGIPESEGPLGIRRPAPGAFPRLATRWRASRSWRSDRRACRCALAGPYFVEPLQWKVTDDCQVLLTCKAKPRPRLQPCPRATWAQTSGFPQAQWLS